MAYYCIWSFVSMNILFISLMDYSSIEEHDIYTDVLRILRNNGNKIYIISPVERRKGGKTFFIDEEGCRILKLRIGNIQRTNIIEKGITTVTIESKLKKAIKKYFSDVKFDLVLYPTPPITICGAVEYVKKRDNARSYLMLKDIFPQNSVDLDMLKESGLKGLIYRYFKAKEKHLYSISDKIGCMSPANKEYLLKHNPEVESSKVEVFPNCIEIVNKCITEVERESIRNKYGIPKDKTVFVYGGNLGKPQGVSFIVDCLKAQKDNDEAFFLIVGYGTDYHLLEDYVANNLQENVKLMRSIPKDDYDTMVGACDIGLIFLDHRFTIPNFPSRLLSYMQAKLPVIAVTDTNTDVGKVIEENAFGWWCESNSVESFSRIVDEAKSAELLELGKNSFITLKKLYDAEKWVEKLL